MKTTFLWILYVRFRSTSCKTVIYAGLTKFLSLQLSTATTNRTEKVIPALKENAAQLPAIFKSIDLLQELLLKVRANVDEAQRRVDAVEAASASSLSVTKLFGVFKKSTVEQPTGPFQVIDTKAEFSRIKAAMSSGPATS